MEEGVSRGNMDSLLIRGVRTILGYGPKGIRFILTVLEDRGKYWLHLDCKLLQLGDYGTEEEISG